jgi:polyhydroxybutyrate depolymerase
MEIDAAGRTRTYTLIEPDGGFDRLLLVFHGSTQNPAKFRSFTGGAFDAIPGTAVTYLEGYRGNWNDARSGSRFPARLEGVDDVAFAEAVVKQHADGREVYAAGYSNGGGMVVRLLHERPDLIAGATIIAAQQPAPSNFLVPGLPVVPKPVLIVHGTADRIVPYEGGQMAAWARFAFKVGGEMLSAPQTAAYFAERNGISAPPTTTDVSDEISRTDHRQDGHAPVRLFTVRGGGHTIPGPHSAPRLAGRTSHELHTTTAMAEFLWS